MNYLDSYRCDENYLQRQFQNQDCTITWKNIEYCEYKCENSQCIEKPIEKTEVPKETPKEKSKISEEAPKEIPKVPETSEPKITLIATPLEGKSPLIVLGD